ncbi:MAG: septum site-determining protein MinD [Clostridia bacterium]
MARKIVITSGKGGVGKTSITASLGNRLANRGKSVLLVDADIGLNNLDVVLGAESRVVYDMSDVIEGKCVIKQAIIQDENNCNLYLLPSAHGYNNSALTAQSFRQLTGKLDANFDFILIDCPAGIDDGFHRAVSGADEAIIITTPHVSSIRDADKVLSMLMSYDLNGVNVIVNRCRGDLILQGEMMSGEEICKILRCPLVGIVPEDDNIAVYSQLGKIGMNSAFSRISFDMVAENILSGDRRLYDVTARFRGVIGKLKMWLERSV